jgi:hypothetical protein
MPLRSRLATLSMLALFGTATTACDTRVDVGVSGGEAQETPVAGIGTLEIPLSTTTPSGDQYRLVGATFDVTGPDFSEQIVDQPDDLLISRAVPIGVYDVELQGRYHLEKNVDGMWTTVPALLVSPNPQAGLVVASDAVTQAIFRFRTREGEVVFAPGELEILIEVEPAGALCGAGTACLTGGFTLATDLPVVNEVPSTGAFAHLLGVPVTFGVSFVPGPIEPDVMPFGRCVRMAAEQVQVAFAGDPTGFLQSVFAPNLAGSQAFLSFCSDGFGGVTFDGVNFFDTPNQWGFELGSTPVSLGLDGAGYPIPTSVAGTSEARLRKYDPFSDLAFGPSAFTLFLP